MCGCHQTERFYAALRGRCNPQKSYIINSGTNDFNSRTCGENWRENLLANYREILTRLSGELPL